jgi:hypothetical protein
MDEGLKLQLAKILLNSSDSENEESFYEESSETSDEINDDLSYSFEDNNFEQDKNCTCNDFECSTSNNYWKAIVEMNGL